MRQTFTGIGKTLAAGLAVLALAGCAGGGGNGIYSNSPAGITTVSLSGEVSAATLVAVNAASNTEVKRVAASTDASGKRTFSLPLPAGKTYKFYLLENEGSSSERVYPVYQGSANSFTISALTSIDLGFIETSSGVARPANDITGMRGVTAAGENTSIPATFAGSAFSVPDLAGTWQVLQLTTGTSPRWVRSVVTIAADGSAPSVGTVSSSGSGTTPSVTYAIAPSGVVTFPIGSGSLFRGVMSKDRGMVVGTGTPVAGEFGLTVMLKSGATYAAGDLRGSWQVSRLQAGTTPSWLHGDAAIDNAGTLSITNVKLNNGPGTDTTMPLAMDASGTVTSPTDPNFYGFLSRDRNLLIALTTNADATVSLTALARTGGTTFSAGSLSGTWRMNWLSASNSTHVSAYWGEALLVSDGQGGDVMRSILLSSGTSADRPVSVGLAPSGNVAISGTDFFGTMGLGGDTIIGTATEGNGTFGFYALVK